MSNSQPSPSLEDPMKTCCKCGSRKPRERSYYYRNPRMKDGLQSTCIACQKSYSKGRYWASRSPETPRRGGLTRTASGTL